MQSGVDHTGRRADRGDGCLAPPAHIDTSVVIAEVPVSVIRGLPCHLVSGDTIHFSRGAVAIWTVDAHVRKIAFCRSAPPRPLALLMRIARKVRRRASAWLRIPAAALPT
jgi:hypothetical protein